MSFDRVAITKMAGPELVALYNKLTGKAVKRFADRKDGIGRVLKALDAQPATPAPAPTPSKPVEASAAPQAAVTPTAAAKPASKAERKRGKDAAPRTVAHVADPGGKLPPPESKRGQLLAALQSPKGMSIEEMEKRFAWKRTDCSDALRLLAKRNGVGVACGTDGRWLVAK